MFVGEYVDVLIVGAGLSGIGAAYHLQDKCSDRSYAIVEARANLGGTWDLFRYPGIRSDSDMYTLGYSFRPWEEGKAIADGPAILRYIRDTARDYGIERKIRYGLRVERAAWSSADRLWRVELTRSESGERVRIQCGFLFTCAGYYRYDQGYTPDLPGLEAFSGPVVHPQAWPEDFECAGKEVLVVGSGATAVTLVPSLADRAALVTMLQRSPTYIVAVPARDRVALALRELLSPKLAYRLTRWKNVALGMFFFQLARRFPGLARRRMLEGVRQALGPDYPVEPDFSPRYNPWDQRVCLTPDGDFFEAMKQGRVAVRTGEIDRITRDRVRLVDGGELKADVLVLATGLQLQLMGGMVLEIDGAELRPAESFMYKGMMLSDVPNFAVSLGYTNASWTLKSDLTGEYVCRLLRHMAAHGYDCCTPRVRDSSLQPEPWTTLSAGYVQRSIAAFPKQGSRAPWRIYNNYLLDLIALRYGKLEDGCMEFSAGSD